MPADVERRLDDADISAHLRDDAPREIIAATKYFSGPLPSPEMLQEYEDILPGAADRIFTLAENEQKQRTREVGHTLWNDSWRVVGSTIVSLGLIVGAVICAYVGAIVPAAVLGGSGAVATIMKIASKSKSD